MALGLVPAGAVAARQVWTRRRFLSAAGVLGAAGLVGLGAVGTTTTGIGATAGHDAALAMEGRPSPLALAEIPSELLALFQQIGDDTVGWHMLAAVACQESRFNPNAVSGAGAAGLMQIMPGTATALGLTPAERVQPERAVPAAHRYLSEQHDRFGTVELMLAAYNAGPGNVERYGGIPPFTETQHYVEAVMAKAAAYVILVPTTVAGGGAPGAASPQEVLAIAGRLDQGAPLEIYPRGRDNDLVHMDPRVLGLIMAIATRHGGVYVSSLKTGHSKYIAGSCARGACRESRHWTYRAADLWKVGGQVVAYGNDIAQDCWVWLKHLHAASGRPATVGSPWGRDATGDGDTAGHFTDGMHNDHFHLDYT